MPYLTPPDVPEERDCRALLIPASTEWLAIVGGALTELSKSWNWQQQGITVDEALAVVNEVISGFYAGCTSSGCTLPGGMPVIRLDEDGHIQQLVDGEWVAPQGIYALPPTPAREEATPEERRCLAAANAANVFETLYEEISDAFQEGMTFQQWTEFLVGLLITLLGTVFGLVIAPLVAIGVLIVGVIYEVLEFITADVWTESFTEMFQCLLYQCSTDDDSVVHFDYQCMLDKLASVTDIFDPTFAQIRLFGQIAYIMQILGAESLDAMGATTAITSADCEDCVCAIELNDPCGYGLIEHLGGTRWRITAQFVTTNYAVCVADIESRCWGYCNIDFVSGAPDYQDFTDCVSTSHIGQPSGCNCAPDTGQQNDIVNWFMAHSSAPFVIELDAYCHEDCG